MPKLTALPTTVVHGDGMVLIFILAVVLVIGIAVTGMIQENKRREALQAIATQLGLSFSSSKDYSLAGSYGFLDRLRAGKNRYAFNVMQGPGRNGEQVCLFDHHYETTSTDSEGKTTTHHHYHSVYTLIMPRSFPELIIEPEGFFAKIAQALGFDDIDFESHEFSRRYKVKSPDKKFAYDFCNARMIDYLLDQERLAIELEGNVLAMIFNGRMNPGNVAHNHDRLHRIRSLMPEYLFS